MPAVSASFSIGCEWQPSDLGDVAERWTTAALVIRVGPWCATELEDALSRAVRSSARLSALRLAEWFASNWWRLLWEPRADTCSWRASHKVGSAGGGYVWPDLSFSSDWRWIRVSGRPTKRREAEPVRYLNHFDELISVGDFERGVDDFIDGAIGRLSALQGNPSELGRLWAEIADERDDPERSRLRRLEACMGYDAGDAPSDLLISLRREMDSFGANAVQEMAAAYGQGAVPRLRALSESVGERGVEVRVPRCGEIRSKLSQDDGSPEAPWQRAERAARIARDIWGLAPPVSTDLLCDVMAVRRVDLGRGQSNAGDSFLVGLRETGASDSFRMTVSSKYGTSRRFGLARLVADHIATGEEDRLLPGTGCGTSRQKFQRAFARELLCPLESLREHMDVEEPSGDAIQDAAQHFDVSPLTVQTMLVTRGALGPEATEAWMA